MAYIEVHDLTKEFRIRQRPKGALRAITSLLAPEFRTVRAVDGASFQIERGELVGYIGPNGAGKSTTIKMLAGILVPTSGTVEVGGLVPHRARIANALRMGVVFGQRSQLYWDLPMEETFALYRKMYRVDEARFKRNVAFYVELLDMKEYLRTPVRQLSLGQKMRADLAVALLHDPEVVYLDEPTIGLDVVAKSRIRTFVRAVNAERRTTVVLTTHDMEDIAQICDRIIMIDRGRIVFDGRISAFMEQYGGEHMITVDFAGEAPAIDDPRLKVIRSEGPRRVILFHRRDISPGEAVSLLTRAHAVNDISIREASIEDVVRGIYEQRAAARQEPAKP